MSGVPRPTERLAFRPWRDDDLALARALFGDARVTALVGGPFDDAQVAARLAGELATQREYGFAYWPIALRAGGDIGCCGLKPRPTPGELELGYYLMPAHWGGGLAAEAARRRRLRVRGARHPRAVRAAPPRKSRLGPRARKGRLRVQPPRAVSADGAVAPRLRAA
ncbi:MAG TPA: GNAT family N-acetyltransferase [Kofleriaceae bacterium]|jgi:hypothetical protein